MKDKVPPYRTPSGLEIGKYYSRPARRELSREEERIQRLFIDNPLDDVFEDLAKVCLACAACLLAAVAIAMWVTI